MTYYNKLPPKPDMDVAIVLDPMLATGGTHDRGHRHPQEGRHAAHQVRRASSRRRKASRRLRNAHPDVPLYLAALDSHLNEVGYIVPGLGDAGDRQFGTA